MSEQNIKLPDFLIADLYKNTLVESEPKTTKLPAEKEKKNILPETSDSIKFLGKNNKNVLILVNHQEDVFLPEDELAFLSNILKACSLNLSDIGIINCANQQLTYADLANELHPGKILLFGVQTTEIKLPFTVPHFQVQNYDSCVFMHSPALREMNEPTPQSTELKKKLWVSLKKMFGV